jgi:4-amino-4-deoxy-L-arabinose transferase-like glycosyltransferase
VSSLQANWAEVEDSTARPLVVRNVLPYLLLAVVSAAYLFPFMSRLPWNPDGGIYIYGAQRVLDGAIPSRDFVELQGPGSFYWLAAFYKLFGVSILTARTVLLLTGIATALLVFHLSRRIGGLGLFPALFVLVTGIPLMLMNSPHYDSNFFGLFAVTIFICAERSITKRPLSKASRVLLLLTGSLAGLNTCFLQQKGFDLMVSFLLSLIILHRKAGLRLATILLLGYCCVIAAEVSLYAFLGALPDLIYANIVWPLSTYNSVNTAPYGFPLWNIWFSNWWLVMSAKFSVPVAIGLTAAMSAPFLAILVLPILVSIAGFASRLTAVKREWVPYWLAAYALWASELQRLDIGHLRNGCLLLVVLFFTACDVQKKKFWQFLAIAITACIVLNGAVNLLGATAQTTPIHTRRGTLLGQKRDAALEFLLAHTKPGEEVFVYPYQPIYYFLADVRNPTRFSNLMYHLNTPEQFREAVHDLDSKKPNYVLWDSAFSGEKLTSIFPGYHHPATAELIMEPYLETHYRQIEFANGFRILQRIK